MENNQSLNLIIIGTGSYVCGKKMMSMELYFLQF